MQAAAALKSKLMAQEFQKSVSKGQAKPEYEKGEKSKTADIV